MNDLAMVATRQPAAGRLFYCHLFHSQYDIRRLTRAIYSIAY